MPVSPALKFEYALRLWFGDRAFGKAGLWDSASSRNPWLRKWTKGVTQDILDLDTDEKHRDRILHEVDCFSSSISKAERPSWYQVFTLMHLIGALLGRLYLDGHKRRNVFYALEPYEHYRDASTIRTPIQEIEDQPTIIRLRYDVILLLRERGVPDWRIAQILNTSVYQLKRLDSSPPD